MTMEETMTANAHGRTAKIIPFPKGGRSGLSGEQQGVHAAEDLLESMRVAYVDYGSGSYHEAAIQDARQHSHEQ
ncbi:MAG: DUF2735 domain-containing protein [Methyloceanibacter sp.]